MIDEAHTENPFASLEYGSEVPDAPVDEAEVVEKASEVENEERPLCFGDGGYPVGHPKWNCSLDRCRVLNECTAAYYAKRREEEQAA